MKRTARRFAITGSASILCLLTPPLSLYAQQQIKRVDGRVLSFQKSSDEEKRNIIEGEERRLQGLLSRKRPHAPLPWEKRPAPKVPYADPIVSLAPTDLGRFDTAFAALSARCHVAVFAEGQPLEPALGKVEREKLTNAFAPDKKRAAVPDR